MTQVAINSGASAAPGYEFAYAEKTTDTTISGTSLALATKVVDAPSYTFDGNTTVLIHIFAATVSVTGNFLIGGLWMDGAPLQDQLWGWGGTPGTISDEKNGYLRYKPAAGAHVFSFYAWRGSANGTILATGLAPAFIRVTRV